MKAKIISKYTFALLLLFSCFIVSCKKNELNSVREPAIVDTTPPTISKVSISSPTVFRGDSVDVTFTATDDKGLYFLKVEYSTWSLIKSITLDGTKKEYTYTVRIGILPTAAIQSHTLKVGAVDVGFNSVSSSLSINVQRKPGVYTEMFVYGDVILAGSLGKAWDYKYAEGMELQSNGTLRLDVYNYKTNGEFMFISSRSSTADILGLQGNGTVAKNATTKIVIPTIGYYRITFNPDLMTYTVATLSSTVTVLNMWVIGDGLVEFAGFDWDLSHAVPMALQTPSNSNIYIKDVTRTASSGAALRVLKSPSWSDEIGFVSILDVDNIADNTFTLSTASSKKFILINGHAGEKYTIKIDVFLNKGLAIKKP